MEIRKGVIYGSEGGLVGSKGTPGAASKDSEEVRRCAKSTERGRG